MAQWFLRKASFNFDMQMTLDQGKEMTLASNTHIPSFNQLVVCIYHFSGHRLHLVSEKSTVFTFSYRKGYVTKFDFAVKEVTVNPGSSFEQTMMCPRPQCFIPSFMEISPLVREKIFEGFLPYILRMARDI